MRVTAAVWQHRSYEQLAIWSSVLPAKSMAGSAYIGRKCVLFLVDGIADISHHHERDEKHIQPPGPLQSHLTDCEFEDT